MTATARQCIVARAWRYESYEGGIEESLILVDGEQIGGVYHCSYNPAESAGWGHNDGDCTGESWASYGPRGYSFGHATREAAESIQVREYVTNPDHFDQLNAEYRAEREAEQLAREAEEEARIAELEDADRRRRLGDDESGPTTWILPAYHVLYAAMDEVEAVSSWFRANDIHDVSAIHDVRVEQRATRRVIVYEAPTAEAAFIHALSGRGSNSTETHVVTLMVEPPGISTHARSDLHDLLDKHWPSRFPLIDYGARSACGHCTHEVHATVADEMILWPCPVVVNAIEGPK